MTVVAHVLAPSDAGDRPVDDAVLDTTPMAADVSAGGPVQDVLLELPADGDRAEPFPAITLTFRMDTADLTATVAETADLAYVTSGNRGLQEFQRALKGTTVTTFGGLQARVPLRGDEDATTPHRDRLLTAYETYLDRLPGRRVAAEATVQATALARARQRLASSREQILAEARRYLLLADPFAAVAVLAGSGPNRLTGPETGGLVADLVAIAGERAALNGLVAAQRRIQQDWDRTKLAMLADDRAHGGTYQPYLTEEQIRQLGRDLAAIPDSLELTAARQRTGDRRESLTHLVAGLAARRPLLFRLWNTDVPFLARRLVADPTAASRSTDLRNTVLGRLRTGYQAGAELSRKLDADPAIVWTFAPLIDDALHTLDADESDFVTRVARDRVREEKPAADLVVASEWLGYAQLAFALGGAEPIAAAVTVAQVAVDLATVVVKAFAAARQQLGEDAFLRPSERLGVPPDYTGALMDAVDIAINVFTSLPFDTKIARDE